MAWSTAWRIAGEATPHLALATRLPATAATASTSSCCISTRRSRRSHSISRLPALGREADVSEAGMLPALWTSLSGSTAQTPCGNGKAAVQQDPKHHPSYTTILFITWYKPCTWRHVGKNVITANGINI